MSQGDMYEGRRDRGCNERPLTSAAGGWCHLTKVQLKGLHVAEYYAMPRGWGVRAAGGKATKGSACEWTRADV